MAELVNTRLPAQDGEMDTTAIDAFQMAGQDIPWLLAHWAERKPDHPLLVWEPKTGSGRQWTYREFQTDVRRLAAGLAANGVAKGDKVLVHADNCPEGVLAWYACAALGAAAVTTNTRSVASELNYFVEHAQCVAAITQPQYASLVIEAAGRVKWIAVTGDNSGETAPAAELDHGQRSFESLLGDEGALPERPAEPLLPAGIQFTSGTTSRPKAVVHTHGNAVWASRVGSRNIDMTTDDVFLVYLPFFHVNAQSWSIWSTLGVGGTVVLQPKFSSSRFWEVVARHGVTHISLLPFVIKALAGQEPPPSKLRIAQFGAIMPAFPQWPDVAIYACYGMTETVTHAISGRPQDGWPNGSMGHPTPGYQVAVVDKDTGELVEEGQTGELWVRGIRGIQLFLEYYDNDEANAKSFTPDGWFKTGDMVTLRAGGNIHYAERDKDLLKVGGENVSARQVEDTCRQVPGIAEIAVVGQSHEMLDQVVVVFVIKAPNAADDDVMAQQIVDVCRAQLADFKVPRAVYFVDEFPRATLDKVAKNKLRELADEKAKG
jgi:crotonobetaine/carnitine-CoA ligase